MIRPQVLKGRGNGFLFLFWKTDVEKRGCRKVAMKEVENVCGIIFFLKTFGTLQSPLLIFWVMDLKEPQSMNYLLIIGLCLCCRSSVEGF